MKVTINPNAAKEKFYGEDDTYDRKKISNCFIIFHTHQEKII